MLRLALPQWPAEPYHLWATVQASFSPATERAEPFSPQWRSEPITDS